MAVLHCCTTFTAESSQELVTSVPQCFEEAEQQAKASGDILPPHLQIVSQLPFVSFFLFYPLSVPFLNSLSSLFPHFPWPLCLLSLLINSQSSQDKDFKFYSLRLLSEALLTHGSSALTSPCLLVSSISRHTKCIIIHTLLIKANITCKSFALSAAQGSSTKMCELQE